ncbi:hemolymph lipopolysaccharide-binding protein-like [Diprion similis]|uniref:hemolymph lipopolysaccharide-binding protein-like n=1 Tax=Diprion similis TaxID=362088 RepID=UPI001EF87E00|nr:hemolymph lipopolysaccharide-binding protein-like [Diprion similis]
MAIISVILQISLYITVTIAQQQSTNPSVSWLYRPSIVYNLDLRHTLLPPQQQRNQSIAVRDDYTYVPGIGAYKVHTRGVPWNEARKTCDEEGGHLVILNSVTEAKKVTELFKKAERFTGSSWPDWVSIGFHDLYAEGEHVTIHGQTLAKAGFSEWVAGEPNDLGKRENCGSLYKNGRLNDHECVTPLGFICELPID